MKSQVFHAVPVMFGNARILLYRYYESPMEPKALEMLSMLEESGLRPKEYSFLKNIEYSSEELLAIANGDAC